MPAVRPQHMRGDAQRLSDPKLYRRRLHGPAEHVRNRALLVTPSNRQRGQSAAFLAKSRFYVLGVPTSMAQKDAPARKLLTKDRQTARFSPFRQRKKQFPPEWKHLSADNVHSLFESRGLDKVETEDNSGGKQFPPVSAHSSPDLGVEGFPDRLKQARERAGFRSARALSQAVHVSDSNIRQYEKGKQEPNMSVLIRLAKACQVSVDWLARGEGPMEYLRVGTVTQEGHVVELGPASIIERPVAATLSIQGENVNLDRLGQALREADIFFRANRKKPTDRERIMAVVVFYNHLTEAAQASEKQT